jgi:hypothetical protein
MSAVSPAVPAASQQAAVEAALVLLERMGLSPADLVVAPRDRAVVPTFAEYVPVVSAAVSAGTRRAYGSYWNRVVEQWGGRRLDEPTPSEIRQLMIWVKTHVVARRNAGRAQRAEAPGSRAALPVPARGRGRADRRGGQPGPQGGQAAAAAVHSPGRPGDPAGRDQPGCAAPADRQVLSASLPGTGPDADLCAVLGPEQDICVALGRERKIQDEKGDRCRIGVAAWRQLLGDRKARRRTGTKRQSVQAAESRLCTDGSRSRWVACSWSDPRDRAA